MLGLLAAQPGLEAIEVKINHRRREQCQELAQRQSADHGVAERVTQFRSRSGAEHQRQAAQQRRHGRHGDRTETQQARLPYRLARRQAGAFAADGEVDQDDAVFLDDADQQNDADDADHRQIEAAEPQRQQRADARRGQRGEDRQRMDVALVKHAENDIDDHQRGRDQHRLVGQRGLERLRIALEAADQRRRHADLVGGALNGVDRLAERDAGRQVERQGHRRELPGMGDQERPDVLGVGFDQGRQRHELSAARRADVDLIERAHIALQRWQHFENEVIGIVGEILRHLALAERIVERVVDELRLDAETGRRIAIDVDGELRRRVLRVACHVSQLRHGLELGQELRRPDIELVQVGILHDVLELAARDAAADGDILRRLQEQPRTGNLRQLRAQPVDDLRGAGVAVVAQLQTDDEAAGILRIAVAWAEERYEVGDVGILFDDGGKLPLHGHHPFRRDVLAGLGNAEQHADILGRKKSFRYGDEHHAGYADRHQEHQQRRKLMLQDEIEAAAIAVENLVKAPFDGVIEAAVLAVVLANQEARAQHRGEREGHHDRRGDCNGEFVEQAADDAAHQQQRNEHRDQRNADRYDGEADLARALDRRLQRRGAGLEMAKDVFHDDDRVIDHETDGDRQRHQRKIVQTVTEEIDDGDGAQERQRHRGAGNERGLDAAQEQQDHH